MNSVGVSEAGTHDMVSPQLGFGSGEQPKPLTARFDNLVGRRRGRNAALRMPKPAMNLS